MTTKLAETAKQAGTIAFSRCLGKGTYDVLRDEQLFVELADLWDCATLEMLQFQVAVSGNSSATHAFLKAVSAQVLRGPAPAKTTVSPQPVLPSVV